VGRALTWSIHSIAPPPMFEWYENQLPAMPTSPAFVRFLIHASSV
jgi:hypothetical protein